MTCEEVRLALGAHALGALDPEEALEIDDHLATCEACGAELLDLEGVASFLGKVSERDVELVSSPPRQVLDRLLNARAKRSRRGRMLLAVAASVAVLAVSGTVWTVVQTGSSPQESSAAAPAAARSQAAPEAAQDSEIRAKAFDEPQPSASPRPSVSKSPAPRKTPKKAVDGREFSGENEVREYYATVLAWPDDEGTELGVRVTGVPVDTTCSLVIVGKDGRRESTESWIVSRDSYQGKAAFKRMTSMRMREIARFEIVDQAGKVLVKVPVPK
ncbi:anti-sigma U factor RsuA [Nonomuraea rosea]|uniref:Anti-sigma U factor RsuA n=1 Tax=Nonomuraea rosea TaxID=638574 RepID=A0ABP6V7L9_9ACTN